MGSQSDDQQLKQQQQQVSEWEENTSQTTDSGDTKKPPTLSQTSNWMSWGTSIMQTATNLTQNLSQTINTALETGIGAPNPEDLSKLDANESSTAEITAQKSNIEMTTEIADDVTVAGDDVPVDNEQERGAPLGGLMAGFGQISKLVESTGSMVITGGLDTLESIGKKTMEVIETPQRLLKSSEHPKMNLSELLKEAAASASGVVSGAQAKIAGGFGMGADGKAGASGGGGHLADGLDVQFEHLFDDYQGQVHYEALEMLSKQCDLKLEDVFETHANDTKMLEELQETMDQVTELCELSAMNMNDDEIFGDGGSAANLNWPTICEQMKNSVRESQLSANDRMDDVDRIIEKFAEIERLLTSGGGGGGGGGGGEGDSSAATAAAADNNDTILKRYVDDLAQLTALFVQCFHHVGESLVNKPSTGRSTANEADGLVQLANNFGLIVKLLTRLYVDKLNETTTATTTTSETETTKKTTISAMFLDASNSQFFIVQAFQLLIPIIKLGAI